MIERKETGREDEVDCRLARDDGTKVKSNSKMRRETRRRVERVHRYECARTRVARLLQRRDGWSRGRFKTLGVCAVERALQRYKSWEWKDTRKEEIMRELVEKGAEMVKALEKGPCLRWVKKLQRRMHVYEQERSKRGFAD